MALRFGNRADGGRGHRRDSSRTLWFGRRLLGGGQRGLSWNDHTLVTSHWSVWRGDCRGSRVLKNDKINQDSEPNKQTVILNCMG